MDAYCSNGLLTAFSKWEDEDGLVRDVGNVVDDLPKNKRFRSWIPSQDDISLKLKGTKNGISKECFMLLMEGFYSERCGNIPPPVERKHVVDDSIPDLDEARRELDQNQKKVEATKLKMQEKVRLLEKHREKERENSILYGKDFFATDLDFVEETKHETIDVQDETFDHVKDEDNIQYQKSVSNDSQMIFKNDFQIEIKDDLELEMEPKNDLQMESNDNLQMDSNDNLQMESNDDLLMESNDDLRKESNDDLRKEFMDDLRMELKDDLKMKLKSGLQSELKDDLQMEPRNDLQKELKHDLKIKSQNRLQTKLKDTFQNESKNDLKKELENNLQIESKNDLQKEPRNDLKMKSKNALLMELKNDLKIKSKQHDLQIELEDERSDNSLTIPNKSQLKAGGEIEILRKEPAAETNELLLEIQNKKMHLNHVGENQKTAVHQIQEEKKNLGLKKQRNNQNDLKVENKQLQYMLAVSRLDLTKALSELEHYKLKSTALEWELRKRL